MKFPDRRSAEQKPATAFYPAAAPQEGATVRVEPVGAPAPAFAVLEQSVKESGDRIARLSSALEAQQKEKAALEAKLDAVEERMRKLSSLTEMISVQYNPFVGEAPREPAPLPAPEAGFGVVPATPRPPGEVQLVPAAPEETATSVAVTEEGAAPPARPEAPAEVHEFRPGFESSLVLLNWASMLLRHAPSRAAARQIVDYYRSIGWLGEPAWGQLLRVTDGLAWAPRAEAERDWRADAELHERSLLYLEKLKQFASREA